MLPIWDQFETKLEPIWDQTGTKLEPKLEQIGTQLRSSTCPAPGTQKVSKLYTCSQNQIVGSVR